MLIGIISDTHDNVEALQKAIKKFNKLQVELVFHCGDWVAPFMTEYCQELNCEIISVFGNNDGDHLGLVNRNGDKVSFAGQCAEKELSGRKLAVYHGTSAPLLESLLSCGKYDAVFSGHTHIASINKIGQTLHVNPGSPSFPRRNAASIAVYNTKDNTAEIIPLQ